MGKLFSFQIRENGEWCCWEATFSRSPDRCERRINCTNAARHRILLQTATLTHKSLENPIIAGIRAAVPQIMRLCFGQSDRVPASYSLPGRCSPSSSGASLDAAPEAPRPPPGSRPSAPGRAGGRGGRGEAKRSAGPSPPSPRPRARPPSRGLRLERKRGGSARSAPRRAHAPSVLLRAGPRRAPSLALAPGEERAARAGPRGEAAGSRRPTPGRGDPETRGSGRARAQGGPRERGGRKRGRVTSGRCGGGR